MELIIPAAGKSTRFSVGKPKWQLQHPTGETMLEKSISGFSNFDCFNRVTIITTTIHLTNFNENRVKENIEKVTGLECGFHALNNQTNSVVETLSAYLEQAETDEPFVVKDCDNFVGIESSLLKEKSNIVVYADLQKFPEVSAPNKSFVEFGAGGILENIVEKRVVSELFSVGVTKFNSKSDFLSGARLIGGVSGETYVSDVIRSVMNLGADFFGVQAIGYEDWGTLEKWIDLRNTFGTVFIDIEGLIFESFDRTSVEPDWNSFIPIPSNVGALLDLENSDRATLVFLSSRPESARGIIADNLVKLGFRAPRILLDLPDAQGVLISCFSQESRYPSARAISLEKNRDNLKAYLQGKMLGQHRS